MTVKGQGALFVNDKRGNDKAPDYRGDFKLTKELLDEFCAAFDNGHDKVDLAGWKKQGQKGTYLSLSVSPPYREQQQSRPTGAPERPQSQRSLPKDEIPW